MFLLALCAGACGCTRVSKPGEVYEAGQVIFRPGKQVVHVFSVRNTTARVVRLLTEGHSCSCTDVRWQPARLAPGESVGLVMTVNVPNGQLPMDVASVVRTDHPDFPAWEYRLRFTSYPQARFYPDRIDLGSFSDRKSGHEPVSKRDDDHYVEVYTSGAMNRPPKFRVEDPRDVHVTVEEKPAVQRLGEGVFRYRYKISSRIDGDFHQPGPSVRSLRVHIDDSPPATAFIQWDLGSDFRATPNRFSFGMVDPKDPGIDKVLVIQSLDRSPFKLVEVETGDSRVTVGTTRFDSPLPVHSLTVHLNCSEVDRRAISGRLRITTDRKEALPIDVPWSVMLRR